MPESGARPKFVMDVAGMLARVALLSESTPDWVVRLFGTGDGTVGTQCLSLSCSRVLARERLDDWLAGTASELEQAAGKLQSGHQLDTSQSRLYEAFVRVYSAANPLGMPFKDHQNRASFFLTKAAWFLKAQIRTRIKNGWEDTYSVPLPGHERKVPAPCGVTCHFANTCALALRVGPVDSLRKAFEGQKKSGALSGVYYPSRLIRWHVAERLLDSALNPPKSGRRLPKNATRNGRVHACLDAEPHMVASWAGARDIGCYVTAQLDNPSTWLFGEGAQVVDLETGDMRYPRPPRARIADGVKAAMALKNTRGLLNYDIVDIGDLSIAVRISGKSTLQKGDEVEIRWLGTPPRALDGVVAQVQRVSKRGIVGMTITDGVDEFDDLAKQLPRMKSA